MMAADGEIDREREFRVNVEGGRVFSRPEQTFPNLTDAEIARMRRFGELRTYKDGERLFETGKPGPGMFVVLSGHVAITQRDGLGHVSDRKSTRLNSSHPSISYAVFCLKKKKNTNRG